VTRYKKKIVAFLAAVAVGCGALVVCSSQSRTAEPAREDLMLKAGSPFSNDPNPFTKSTGNLGTGEMFFKMTISVLLVIALGAAAIYISKKFLPRITNVPGKKIRVIETVHLGPRKAIHLIETGGQQLLIGSTNESITMLANVTGAANQHEGHLGTPEALSETDLPGQKMPHIFENINGR
jgi:flagellar biosynthetic protein FliO